MSLFVVGVGLGVCFGALRWRHDDRRLYHQERMPALLSQAAQMPPGGALLIGDSIAERWHIDSLCGLPLLKAGVSRSNPADWTDDAPKLIAASRPKIVVLELGTNASGDWQGAFKNLARVATFAIYPADPRKAAIERSMIRGIPGNVPTIDGQHPTPAGYAQLGERISGACG